MAKYKVKMFRVVDAIQYKNDPQAVMYFVGHDLKILPDKSLVIGGDELHPGDWIIKDKGEFRPTPCQFYPCNPNIFEATYELVKE